MNAILYTRADNLMIIHNLHYVWVGWELHASDNCFMKYFIYTNIFGLFVKFIALNTAPYNIQLTIAYDFLPKYGLNLVDLAIVYICIQL